MRRDSDPPTLRVGTIEVARRGAEDASLLQQLLAPLAQGMLAEAVRCEPGPEVLRVRLSDAAQAALGPGHDTLGLAPRLAWPGDTGDQRLAREVLVAMLLGPCPLRFPSVAELAAAVRIRCNIVRAARATRLTFDTRAVARPVAFWDHDEDRGFVVRPGVSLIDALRQATQPAVSGGLYAFSCYRATEYVMLLGLAEELQEHRPPMYAALERLWRQRAVVSGEFHEVFLREIGSQAEPLPMRWYVPGDRVWFRNPDEPSSDASGYEGSWVIYLGNGEFGNFWQSDRPFRFDAKCIEVYHWRHALFRDAEGELRIDEACVAEQVSHTLADPVASAHVLAAMQRYRDGRGVYADGGCIDSTREQLKWVCEGTSDLVLPAG